ncbi:MAG: OB-fold-containig protein [Erythrobacter sp.]
MALLEPHNLPFLIAFGLLALTALGQVLGLSDALDGAGEFEAADGLAAGGFGEGLASLLGLGRVPLMIWLTMLLFVFGTLGVVGQAVLDMVFGAPLPAGIAALVAGISALPLNGLAVRPIGAIMPRDETTAVTLDDLIRRDGEIQIGTAKQGSPARAKVIDHHGQAHFVMVEPHDHASTFHEGDTVLIVRREGETFFAVQYESPLLGLTN